MDAGVGYALRKLVWMGQRQIWPNGLRYLWTDGFGVVLLGRAAREAAHSPRLWEPGSSGGSPIAAFPCARTGGTVALARENIPSRALGRHAAPARRLS